MELINLKRLFASRPERKRLFELVLMVGAASGLVALSRLERVLFELSERLSEHRDFITSVIYFGLININVILVLVLAFLIIRNLLKLVVERRKGVIGSRLRTKLIVAFVLFAVAPTILLFYVSNRFLTESFDTWFSSRVESTIHKTREAGALVYERDQRRVESLARIALQRVKVETFEPIFGGISATIHHNDLKGFTTEYQVDKVSLYDLSGRLIWASGGAVEAGDPVFVREAIANFQASPGLLSSHAVEVENDHDVVKGVAPVTDPRSGEVIGAVLTEEQLETQIIRSVETILAEFASLKPAARLIRLSYTIILVVMVLVIVFAATWLGFYVARGITGPLQSLAEATKEVALGNYDISLKTRSDDETGQLVTSFNQMTRDLKDHETQAAKFTNQLKDTNTKLDAERKYMEVILNNITSGVLSVDQSGIVTSISRFALRLLGLDEASASVGMPLKQVLGDKLWEVFWKPVEESLEELGTFSSEIDLSAVARDVTLLAEASVIRDEMGQELGYIIVFDDASEQVKAQRVAAWREVARRIAHEIKNPITPVKLSAQRLLRRFVNKFDGQDRKVFESCIETIISEVDSLRDLVNEFSKFSRLPSVKVRDEDLGAILRDVTNFFSLSYPHIAFDADQIPEKMAPVPVDKEQIHRVFVNILSNSVAAIPSDRRDPKIVVSCHLLDGVEKIVVEFADNGVGIPDHLKARVLEPYFSTKDEGTGLGLAIVNQIVSEHGGYLRVSNNQWDGTTISIELPSRIDVLVPTKKDETKWKESNQIS